MPSLYRAAPAADPEIQDDFADLPDVAAGELPALLRFYSPTPPRLPARPTCTRPGTTAKVAVMAQRFARGERIYHPDDLTVAKLSDDLQRAASMQANSHLDRDGDPAEPRKSA